MEKERPALRAVGIVVIGLVSLLVISANRLIASGPPFERETLWLAVIFASSGALVGLSTLAVVLAPGHWSTRVSCCAIAGSMIAGGWSLFADWNAFLIWQVVLIGLIQTFFVAISAAIVRARGIFLDWPGSPFATRAATQLTINNLLLLTAASALLASVVSLSRPVGYSWAQIAILVAGGVSAGVAVLTGAWAVTSRRPLWFRVAAALLLAPHGGVVYATCKQFMWLLLSAKFFALVTTMITTLVIVSLAYLRRCGITIRRRRSD